MEKSKLSLKWLEAFQAVARRGSVRDAAAELNLSISTVSHHLSCLEGSVGAALFDHSKRPMRITPEGAALLRRVDEAMGLLRKGVAEIWTDDLSGLSRTLRIAHVEDFDTDVGPDLAGHLGRLLPGCEFSLLTRPSHEVLELLQSDQVDIGIASAAEIALPGLIQSPLLRDPFVLVAPVELASIGGVSDLIAMGADLPFLRYSKQQIMGRRIAAQLGRIGMRPTSRMEFESTHAVLSMVAAGQGWAITTALNYARGQRYQAQVSLLPLTDAAFARQMTVFAREDLPAALHGVLDASLRRALRVRVIAPLVAQHGWLASHFHLLGDTTSAAPRAGMTSDA